MKFAAIAFGMLYFGGAALLASPARSLDLFDTPKVIEEMSKLPHMQDCKSASEGKLVAACRIRQIPPRISSLDPLIGNFQNWLLGDTVVFQIWVNEQFSKHDGVFALADDVIAKFSMPKRLSQELSLARTITTSGYNYQKDIPGGSILVERKEMSGVRMFRIYLAFKPA